MKINARSFKHIKSYVVFCLLVTLMFPYSLLAAETNYRVPRNSLSYFLQNPSQKKYLETTTESPSGSVIPPLTSIEDVRGKAPVTEEIVQPVLEEEPATVQDVYTSKTAVDEEPVDLTMSWHNETPNEIHVPIQNNKTTAMTFKSKQIQEATTSNVIVASREETKATPVKLARHQRRHFNNNSKATKTVEIEQRNTATRTILASVPATKSPFARALAKMRSRKAARDAEAQKMGITLPSQNGDIASVSPSLSKINSTVNQILARHAANNSRV